MDPTGIRLNCSSTNNKNQIPSVQSFRNFSTASIIPTKMVHYPFVRLGDNKMESAPVYQSDTNLSKPNIAEKTNLFRNFSKSCHQLPATIGGFVGSKSQGHLGMNSREPRQIWDLVDPIFRRVSEFVNSNHNLLGNYCPDNSALAFILSNGNCRVKNPQAKPAEPSPNKQHVDPIVTPKPDQTLSSPPILINIGDLFLSQVTQPSRLLAEHVSCSYLPNEPLVSCGRPNVPLQSSKPVQADIKLAEEPVALYSIVKHPVSSKPKELLVNCKTTSEESYKPIPISASDHKSYAEVARMCRNSAQPFYSKNERRIANSSRRKNNYFGHVRNNKSNQRAADHSNWREQNCEIKDVRRDKLVSVHPSVKSSDVATKYRPPSQCLDTQVNRHGYQKRGRYDAVGDRRHGKNDKSHKPWRVVHEKHPNYDINRCAETLDVSSCQYDDPNEDCKNWRCRQHSNKPTPKETTVNSLPSSNISPKNRIKTSSEKFVKIPCATVSRGLYPDRSRSVSESSRVMSPPTPLAKLKDLTAECSEAVNNFRRRSFSENKDALLTSLSRAAGCVAGRESAAGCVVGRDSVSSSGSGRSLSECSADSEDSFVIFGDDADDCETLDSDETDSEGSESESESEDECKVSLLWLAVEYDDPVTSPRLKEVNDRWDHDSEVSQPKQVRGSIKKVTFSPHPAAVHRMVRWDFAYRAARCGPWEQLARDRERFRQRVARCEVTLAPVLALEHRRAVHQQLTSRSASSLP